MGLGVGAWVTRSIRSGGGSWRSSGGRQRWSRGAGSIGQSRTSMQLHAIRRLVALGCRGLGSLRCRRCLCPREGSEANTRATRRTSHCLRTCFASHFTVFTLLSWSMHRLANLHHSRAAGPADWPCLSRLPCAAGISEAGRQLAYCRKRATREPQDAKPSRLRSVRCSSMTQQSSISTVACCSGS